MVGLPLLLDLLFPERCVLCNKSKTRLCDSCISLFEPAYETPLPWAFATWKYKQASVRHIIKIFKYKNDRQIARACGRALYDTLLQITEHAPINTEEKIVLIPVPLSKNKLRKRGYNQAELLAKALVHTDTENLLQLETNIVIRTKDTETQTLRGKYAREQNIRDAFVPGKEYQKVSGKIAIIIDDVITTGSTMRAIRKVLREAGARRVIGLSLAH